MLHLAIGSTDWTLPGIEAVEHAKEQLSNALLSAKARARETRRTSKRHAFEKQMS